MGVYCTVFVGQSNDVDIEMWINEGSVIDASDCPPSLGKLEGFIIFSGCKEPQKKALKLIIIIKKNKERRKQLSFSTQIESDEWDWWEVQCAYASNSRSWTFLGPI